LYIIFLSKFTPSHLIPSSISLYASGSICLTSEPIVSSITNRSLPSYILQYSSFKIKGLAFPMCSGPDGNGAIRITTFPFSAFGNSLRPSRISLFEVLESSFENCSCCFFRGRAFTSFRTFCIVGMMSFIFDFSKPSAKSPAKTAPWLALPLYLIAFSRA